MSQENIRIARRWFEEVWNQKRDETIDEILAPDVVAYLEGWEVQGREEFRAARAELLESFPDLSVDVKDLVAHGEKVAIRWIAGATHQGSGFGFPGTGNEVRFRGMTWLVIEGGRIVRSWDAWNLGGVIQELLFALPGEGLASAALGLKLLKRDEAGD